MHELQSQQSCKKIDEQNSSKIFVRRKNSLTSITHSV